MPWKVGARDRGQRRRHGAAGLGDGRGGRVPGFGTVNPIADQAGDAEERVGQTPWYLRSAQITQTWLVGLPGGKNEAIVRPPRRRDIREGHYARMSEMTPEELDAIDARGQRGLPGPWWASWEGRDHTSGDSFIGTGQGDHRGPDIYVTTDDGPAGVDDLDFIADARQDIPRLTAEVRRLRRLLIDRA